MKAQNFIRGERNGLWRREIRAPPKKKIVKREKGHKTNKQTNKTGKRENQHVKREGRLSLKT